MLYELIGSSFYGKCPVCGRVFFSCREPFVTWCPYCGVETKHYQENENNRITGRDMYGTPIYTGNLSWNIPEYAGHLSRAAVEEILRKLCEYEEKDEAVENNGEEDG